MALHTSFPLIVYGISPNSETDYVEEVPVTSLTTTAQVIEFALKAMFGPHVETSEYALYETEFVKDKSEEQQEQQQQQQQQQSIVESTAGMNPDSKQAAEKRLSDRKSKRVKLYRRYVRELSFDEYPLLVSIQWKLKRHAAYYNFTVKRKEPEVPTKFTLIRREQCRNLSVPQVQKRLEMIEMTEKRHLFETSKKYDYFKRLIQERLNNYQRAAQQ